MGKETTKNENAGCGQCPNNGGVADQSKRDFMVMAANGLGVVGACAVAWPLIDSMNPSADVLAQSSIEVDITDIAPGAQKRVMWRGKPIFIWHRTPEEIKEAEELNTADLRDPQTDDSRVIKGHEEWLVMIGVCTHLGCVPQAGQGDFGGYFCSCHGSQYDTSGRIRKGPAPKNLAIPPYAFVSPTKIFIGGTDELDPSLPKHKGTLA